MTGGSLATALAPATLPTQATVATVAHTAHHAVYSLDIQTLLIITGLAFLPALILMMTPFTRIIVVLAIFRHSLGLTTTPPNMILVALALILSVFVMRGPLETINAQAIQPYLSHSLTFTQAVKAGKRPLRKFMQGQTRRNELRLFVNLAHPGKTYKSLKTVPFIILVPAFVTSELQTAFEVGFLIYIPFVLIDLAVAAVLMALGMIMVSPTLISLPIKLLLFVSIGGWGLLLGSLARSFVH